MSVAKYLPVCWRCGDGAACCAQGEVTLYLVSSAALGGYLASAALFVLSGAPPLAAWSLGHAIVIVHEKLRPPLYIVVIV